MPEEDYYSDILGFAPPTYPSYEDQPGDFPLPGENYQHEGGHYPNSGSTQGPGGSPVNATTYESLLNQLVRALSSGRGLAALAGAGFGLANSAGPSGGGSKMSYAGPRDLGRQIVQGPNGLIAKYNPQPVRAAIGGPLYAQGGPVQLEHGGFVMTKRAVDGAGGPQGIAQLAPGAQMFRGPGTGTSDSMRAEINGPNGKTPALVSNGEAYLPKQAVQNAGGTRQMMALMKNLENRRG